MWTDRTALTPPPWADAWLVSASWLLRLVPQWTWACEDLPESDRGTAGSCGSSTCNFLRKLRAVSRTGCAVSRSDQQCASFPLSPRGRRHGSFCYRFFPHRQLSSWVWSGVTTWFCGPGF